MQPMQAYPKGEMLSRQVGKLLRWGIKVAASTKWETWKPHLKRLGMWQHWYLKSLCCSRLCLRPLDGESQAVMSEGNIAACRMA